MTLFNPDSARLNSAANSIAARALDGASLKTLSSANFHALAGPDGLDLQINPDLLGLTVARASRAWNPNWTGLHGDRVGRLVEYGPNRVRSGDHGVVRETAAATNRVQNPRFEGGVVGTLTGGSPTGTIPTRMELDAQGATVEFIGYEVTAGRTEALFRFSGTPTGDPILYFEPAATAIASATTNTRTGQATVRLAAGALTNTAGVAVRVQELTSAGANVTGGSSAFILPDANQRGIFNARTLSGGGTVARARHGIIIDHTSGAIDLTLAVSVPQFESGLVATTPVLPPPGDPGEFTRAAETFTFDGWEGARASREYYINADGSLSTFITNATAYGTSGIAVFMAATNRIRNPRALGAVPGVIGSGGAYPTNWGEIGPVGTREIIGRFEDETGAFLRIKWTATAGQQWTIRFDTTTLIPIAPNQSFAYSARTRLSGGSSRNFTHRLMPVGRTAAGGFAQNLIDPVAYPATSAPQRLVRVAQVTSATVERLSPQFIMSATGDVDITLDIYEPQVETNRSFAGPPVLPAPTEIAESTRAASAPRIITRPQLFQRTGVTILGEVVLSDFFGSSSNRQAFGNLTDGTGDLRHYAYITNAGIWRLFAWDGALLFPQDLGLTTDAARPRQRVAVRWSDANVGWAVSDGLNTHTKFDIVPDRSLQLENCTRIFLGTETTNRQINGLITEFQVIPGLLSDAELSEYVAF